jgi:hypothetical protein
MTLVDRRLEIAISSFVRDTSHPEKYTGIKPKFAVTAIKGA